MSVRTLKRAMKREKIKENHKQKKKMLKAAQRFYWAQNLAGKANGNGTGSVSDESGIAG